MAANVSAWMLLMEVSCGSRTQSGRSAPAVPRSSVISQNRRCGLEFAKACSAASGARSMSIAGRGKKPGVCAHSSSTALAKYDSAAVVGLRLTIGSMSGSAEMIGSRASRMWWKAGEATVLGPPWPLVVRATNATPTTQPIRLPQTNAATSGAAAAPTEATAA